MVSWVTNVTQVMLLSFLISLDTPTEGSTNQKGDEADDIMTAAKLRNLAKNIARYVCIYGVPFLPSPIARHLLVDHVMQHGEHVSLAFVSINNKLATMMRP